MRSSSYFLSVEIDTTIVPRLVIFSSVAACQLQVELHSYHLLESVMPPVIIWCCERNDGIRWSQHPFLDLVLHWPLRNWQCWWVVCFAFIGRVTLLQAVAWHAPLYCWYQYILPHLVIDEVPLVKILSQEGTRLRRVDTCRHLCRVLNFAVIWYNISTQLLSGEVILLGLSSISLDHSLLMR